MQERGTGLIGGAQKGCPALLCGSADLWNLAQVCKCVPGTFRPSRRALYEAIADASQVLVQYERDGRFVTPLRAEFGLVRRDGSWKLKMIHFSHPASGFRSVRLLNAPDDLVE